MIRAGRRIAPGRQRKASPELLPGSVVALLLLLGTTPLAAAPAMPKEHAQIAADLEAGKIADAEERCLTLPRQMYDVAARLPYGASRPPQPEIYADLFARCAVVSLRARDSAEAGWRWAAGHVFDANVAREAAGALGALADLPTVRRTGQDLPPLAVVEKKAWRDVETWMLGAPNDVFRPNVTDRSRLSLRGGFKCTMQIEAILGRNGRLRDPALVSHDHCVLTQVAVILDSLGRRPYPPARSEAGEPIDVAYLLTLAESVEPDWR